MTDAERPVDEPQWAAQPPALAPGQTFASVTDHISALVLTRPVTWTWLIGLGISLALLGLMTISILYLLVAGVGIWGINVPVGWGFAIVNFVWWIGIGHAGTLISAVLLLLHQNWRTSINRFAEAMTLFTLACAGLFPLLHMGRPWFAYWLAPYPSTHGVWPIFTSPLVWDMFAILTYFVVSLLFWYIGMVPDLAALRDRARTRLAGRTYGFLAMGWRGDAEHWDRYERAYLLLAGLAAPLVVSVHTITAFDFAASILPGWHSTLLAPYFVAAAIFSGFAMVIVLAIPIRAAYRLYAYITDRHLQNLGKILLATGLMVGYSYIVENFTAWYSGNHHEMSVALDRVLGPFAGLYWAMVILNVGVPQLLWFGRVRSSPVLLWLIGVVVLIGMWLDRYVIIISSLQRDFLPSSWGPYSPTIWDWGLYIGTFGLFFTLLFLFLRFLPLISIFEVRAQLPQAEVRPGEPSCP